MTPYDFEKHSQRVGPQKWKDHIWVILNDEKVTPSKTCLIKYYKHGSNEVSTSCRGKHNFHCDEFVTCSLCEKEHRFRLRTKEDCMIYHAADKKWKCSDRPYDRTGSGCSGSPVSMMRRDTAGKVTGDVLKVPRNARIAILVCVLGASSVCLLCVYFMQNAEP
ncbi:hypothetical protein LWI28_006178 [Acer negundo]|uniref:Uncharacterized protein n=1 Tax=Acer negundo TaxID=4023 RepID=A0AAD5J391_ACENE|nr:hypothetical protein LWI28_006178 [Acer negundo]